MIETDGKSFYRLIGTFRGVLTAALDHLVEEIRWPRFMTPHMMFFEFLIIYACAKTVIDVIGGDKFKDISRYRKRSFDQRETKDKALNGKPVFKMNYRKRA